MGNLGFIVMIIAGLAILGFVGFTLWRQGKLARVPFLPKPPTEETKP